MSKVIVNKAHTLKGHTDCVYALEGVDSANFLSSGADGQVVMWNLESPEEGRLLAKVPTSVYAMGYDQANKTIYVAQNFEGVHKLDITAKKEISSLKLSNTYYFEVKVLGNVILVAGGDGMVYVINKAENTILKKLNHSDKSARAIAVNLNSNEFAVAYSDNYVRIFNLEDYSIKHEIEAHKNSVFSLKYSPDGKLLLSGSRDAHLKVWDVQQGYQLRESIVAHMYAINNIDYSPNGKHFVTCSMDKSIKVWDADSFRLLKVIDKARHAGHGTSVNKLFWSRYNHQLVSCSDDRTISVWNLNFDNEYENHAIRN